MPRAIWTGAISFGLVNVPVRMYSAIDEHKLHFNYIHEKDGSRIGYEKVCKSEGKPVPDDEIVKAFEWEKGEYVPMRDEDFERRRRTRSSRSTSATSCDYDEIDPIFFERTYYLGPQDGAEKVYALLVRAMEESGRAAIAKFVMRDRQHLGCLRVPTACSCSSRCTSPTRSGRPTTSSRRSRRATSTSASSRWRRR